MAAHAISAQCAAVQAAETADRNRAVKIRAERRAARRGGDQLIANAVEAGIEVQTGRNQVVDGQILRGAFRQRDHDVVQHAFADHQVVAGRARRTRIAVGQRATGVLDGNGRRRHLFSGGVGQIGRREVGTAFDARVIG